MAAVRQGSTGGHSGRGSSTPQNHPPAQRILNEQQLEKYSLHMQEVGGNAVWMVSSAKYGNGVQQLRDGDAKTFWQSDGVLPHSVRVEFPKLTPLSTVGVCLSFTGDESYTPTKLSILAGTHESDIAEVALIDVSQPNGWVLATLNDDTGTVFPSAAPGGAAIPLVYCTVLIVTINENHQQGRDTHVRGIKVFSPFFGSSSLPSSTTLSQHLTLR